MSPELYISNIDTRFPHGLLRKVLQNTGSFISEIAELPFSGLDDTFTACSERLNVSLFLRKQYEFQAENIRQQQIELISYRKDKTSSLKRFQEYHIKESVLSVLTKHGLDQGSCLVQTIWNPSRSMS